MVYSKQFTRHMSAGKQQVVDVVLSGPEERQQEQIARQENMYLMRQCIADARNIVHDEKLMDMQNHVLQIATALFGKRARHANEYKDEAAQQKFWKCWPTREKGKKGE